ncbi:hypothetical protein [Paenibacillus lemnae]|uniref:Uncharacterized protein n=1 Tax=Paenibacillus lemnae TaxID=1330551 RepID=A0A848M5M7_PAELE|nr:hypothetical protein [Paenibacillus lemnae]NMO96257.1 hypothetical protein [Paenibacillus lemnae]
MKYLLTSFTRSYQYFGPLAFIVIFVLFLYSYRPNPVMDSYAVTSCVIFIGSAWLGMNFLNHDHGRQTGLLILHVQSSKLFYWIQFASAAVIGLMLSASIVIYPLWSGMFDRSVSMAEFGLAITAHMLLALLGISLSLYVQNSWIPNRGRAAGLLLLMLVLSMSGLSMQGELPAEVRWLVYLLPPVSPIIEMLMKESEVAVSSKILIIVYVSGYIALLAGVYLHASSAKDTADLVRKAG